MASESGVLGVFTGPRSAAAAIRAARAAGSTDVRAAMPAPFPEVVEALGRPESALGFATFFGALAGLSAGYALCIGTSLAWPLITGGKPIVSLPSFTIVGFEVTVLIGVLVSIAALLALVVRGRRRRAMPFDPRFTAGHLGVFAIGGDASVIESAFRANGAEEVRRA